MNKTAKTNNSHPPPQNQSNIFIENKDNGFSINEFNILRIFESILLSYQLSAYELTICFVEQEEIEGLNRHYRSKDKPTDVLSFPQTEFESPITSDLEPKHSGIHNLLGDIVICLQAASKNAELIGHSLSREVIFLCIHGILHLGGHDHKTSAEEKVMIKTQTSILAHLESIYANLDNFEIVVREGTQ